MLGLTTKDRPRLAYGLWRYGEDDQDLAIAMLAQAREAGIDHFDAADVYGGRERFGGVERLLGALRARAPSLFDGATLATKAGVEPGSPYNSSAAYIVSACEASLKRLGVDRLDLFYVHRPDVLTHPNELAGALERLMTQGKVAAIGVSNYAARQIDALAHALTVPIAVCQIEISAAHPAAFFDGALDLAMQKQIPTLAWSPLAGGRLASGDEFAAVRAKLAQIAHRHGVSVEAAALAFLLRHPAGITPIVGTKTPERLAACLGACSVEMTRAEWYGVAEAALGRPLP
jgi:predicted oxidoreductase